MSMELSKEGFIPNHRPIKIKLPINKEKRTYYQLIADQCPINHFSDNAGKMSQNSIPTRRTEASVSLKISQSKNKKGLKVAILSLEYHPGEDDSLGLMHPARLATALNQDGYEVHVFTQSNQKNSTHETVDGINYHYIPFESNGSLLEAASSFSHKISQSMKNIESKDNPFHVIHCFDCYSAKVIKSLPHDIPRRVIYSPYSHSWRGEPTKDDELFRQKKFLEQQLIELSDGIVCCDQEMRAEIQNCFSVPGGKFFILQKTFNWEDYQWIKDPGEVKKKYDIWPLDPLVLFVGEFTHNYGFDILLDAIPKLLKNNSNVRFMLVGGGELMWPLKLNARYLFFDHAVRLVGHKEGRDLQELFQAADIVVIPNKISTSPYQLLAGWSAKKLVIATNAGGCNLIKHEENGILIHNNSASVKWGIERILSDWNKGHEMAQKGWGEIQREYTGDAIFQKIKKIYM